LWNNLVPAKLKNWKLRRYEASVAVGRHNAEGPFPSHKLRIDKVAHLKPGQASVGKLAPYSLLPAKYTATEAINTGELIRSCRLDGHV